MCLFYVMQTTLIKILSRSSSLEKPEICYILQGGRGWGTEGAFPLGGAEARVVFAKTDLRRGEHVTRSVWCVFIHSFIRSFIHMFTHQAT